MRWDDLQILKVIDESEGSDLGPLASGLNLLNKVGQGKQIDAPRETPFFARELVLARQEGYLEFDDRVGYGMRLADPRSDAFQWLQQIRDLRLTLKGRDRARGQVVVSTQPDSEEDDGRPITGLTLEAIANEIAKTYTASQLPTFLHDSEIPDQFIPKPMQGDKSSYVAHVLTSLQDGGSGARRALRRFIARWLTGQLHVPPSEAVGREIVGHLGQQGWHVRGDSLAIGDRIAAVPKTSSESPTHAKVASPEALIKNIRLRINDGKELRATLGRVITEDDVEQVSAQYRQWHDGNRQFLISSGRHDLLEAYDRRRFTTKTLIGGSFRDSVREADDDIRISLERLQELVNGTSQTALARPVTDIERIADRIDIVARQLTNRKRGRNPFVINDEYDLQDLIHSLLRLVANDVRPEEWTPSYGGNSARADFLMPIEETVVEAKFARTGHGNREIANELAIDVERYRKLKECRHLICIVYDPNRVIENPVGFETDLARSEPMRVSVWVRPTR